MDISNKILDRPTFNSSIQKGLDLRDAQIPKVMKDSAHELVEMGISYTGHIEIKDDKSNAVIFTIIRYKNKDLLFAQNTDNFRGNYNATIGAGFYYHAKKDWEEKFKGEAFPPFSAIGQEAEGCRTVFVNDFLTQLINQHKAEG